MTENIDKFIEASKELVGKEVKESKLGNVVADLGSIVGFTTALGDDNSFFVDPAYAAKRRFGCIVAPLTFLAAVRYPISEGAFSKADYGLANFLHQVVFERYNVIRVGDKLSAEVKLKDVKEDKAGEKRVAYLTAEGNYRNQHQELVGMAEGVMKMIPFKRGEEMFVNRDMYVYSDEEVKRIETDLDGEVKRGAATLYWSDVKVGDVLTPVVKGPVNLHDISGWRSATRVNDWSLELTYREARDNPGLQRVNPVTGWPYWNADLNDQAYHTCVLSGISLPFIPGLLQACLAEHLVNNWISDDGFLQRLEMEVKRPFIYGDVNWYMGTVKDKYKEKRGGILYGAVEIGIEVVNQLREMTASGTATVYLPSPGHEVALPIPRE